MRLTVENLSAIAGSNLSANQRANIASVIAGLDLMGARLGLNKPHRLAHYVAQIGHESGLFKFDREVWGPTPAQQRYDTRTDLGNTAARDGDGEKYKGRTGIQVTGKSNYQQFTTWCRDQGLNCPDFVDDPEAINLDPWEGIAPLWYWSTRNLNRYADANNIEMVTRRINGGLNGYQDRLHVYTRAALVILGFRLEEGVVKAFQRVSGLTADDIAGPKTRDALHKALVALDVAPVPTSRPDATASEAPADTAPSAPPVVEPATSTPVAVTPESVIKPNLTPLQQMNKPVQGAKAGFAVTGVAGAILYLWSTTPYFPASWQNDTQATIALTLLFGNVPGLIAYFIGAYRARDKRFQ